MTPHASAWLTGLCLLATCAVSASIAFAGPPASQPAAKPSPEPTKELTPEQVAKVVVAALKANDAQDTGIRTTFKFASPANQDATGPIERFIPLVKNAAYAPLLNHASSSVHELARKDDQAAELVTVTAKDGTKSYFIFQLSKQHDDGKLKDCWMTDGVIPVQPKAQDDGHSA